MGYPRTFNNKVCDPIWNMTDVINIVDTWKHEKNTITELKGFTLMGSTWNQRRQTCERDQADIAGFIFYLSYIYKLKMSVDNIIGYILV